MGKISKQLEIVVQKKQVKDLLHNPDLWVLIPLPEEKFKLTAYLKNQALDIVIKGKILARSILMHRKFFGILRKLVQNCNYFITEEQALEWVKFKIRYIKTHIIVDGVHHIKTDSISFANMPQFEFNGFFKKSVTQIAGALDVTEESLLESNKDTE